MKLSIKGTELAMDWGCWHEISTILLPKQAFMSNFASQQLEKTKALLHENGIDFPDDFPESEDESSEDESSEDTSSEDKNSEDKLVQLQHAQLSKDKALQYARKDSSAEKILWFLFGKIFGDTLEQRPAKQGKTEKFKIVSDVSSIGIDPTLVRTTRPCGVDCDQLSERCRNELDTLTGRTAQANVRKMLDSCIFDYVEVREILDIRNPAKLFAIPGEKVYGVFANQDFNAGDPVMCYAGYLMDNDVSEVENGYLFEVKSEYYLEGNDGFVPDMFINGKESVAGLINDALSLGCTARRNANLTTEDSFDPDTNNPMILLVAKTKISKGEELLYSYGDIYWRVMLKVLMQKHASFALQAEDQNNTLLEQLSYDF
jgi:SET domain